jgi:TPR repeat protein
VFRKTMPQPFAGSKNLLSRDITGARIKLGYMYAEGRGTGKDPEAAYAWITAASLARDPRGKDLLRSLETVLKPEQIARARQRASSFAIGTRAATLG